MLFHNQRFDLSKHNVLAKGKVQTEDRSTEGWNAATAIGIARR